MVAEPGEPARQISEALRAGGYEVRQLAPDDAFADDAPDVQADIVLICASLGLPRLVRLNQRLSGDGGDGRPPRIVVFPDGDLAALEACVLGGFDYIAPPYLPSLINHRLTVSALRGPPAATGEEVANEASLSEYEHELSIARDIQSGFLPDQLSTPEGWEIAARFRPAKEVGGDFYDMFALVEGRRLGLIVADVCDKGVGAALFMALIRTLLRHTAQYTSDWDQAQAVREDRIGEAPQTVDAPPVVSIGAGPLVQSVTGTNSYLTRNHLRQGYFATLFFGVLDPETGALLYINGGHVPPVLLRADGSHSVLCPTGPAVGMLPDGEFSLEHAQLEPGDLLFMCTDGVTEARDPAGAFFGADRLLDAMTGTTGLTAGSMIDVVDHAVRDHAGYADQFDDITMLALSRSPG
jgi:hypothetical protein